MEKPSATQLPIYKVYHKTKLLKGYKRYRKIPKVTVPPKVSKYDFFCTSRSAVTFFYGIRGMHKNNDIKKIGPQYVHVWLTRPRDRRSNLWTNKSDRAITWLHTQKPIQDRTGQEKQNVQIFYANLPHFILQKLMINLVLSTCT